EGALCELMRLWALPREPVSGGDQRQDGVIMAIVSALRDLRVQFCLWCSLCSSWLRGEKSFSTLAFSRGFEDGGSGVGSDAVGAGIHHRTHIFQGVDPVRSYYVQLVAEYASHERKIRG